MDPGGPCERPMRRTVPCPFAYMFANIDIDTYLTIVQPY